MYRLILLDDEEFVIKGIQKVYDLPKYGFEVVGTFTSPIDALEHLEELAPDLVITDVKTPAMDGLEFAGEVKKLYPDIEIVILSGYDDFSYAQAAVKLGVGDYLLKPIKRDDFIAMLARMYDRIEEKHLHETSYQALEQLVEDNVVELVNRFYLRLAEDNYFDEHLYEAIKDRGLSDFKDDDFLLIKMDMGQMSATWDYMSEIGRIIQEIEMTLFDYGKVFSFWSDESLYVVVYDLNEEQYEEICDSVTALVETEHFRAFSFSVGFSDINRGLENLFFAYADCARHIFFQEANIDTASEAETLESREVNVTLPYSEIEKLFHAISLDDADGIDASLDQIYVIPEQDIPIVSRDYVSSITFLILLRIYQTQSRYSSEDEIVKKGTPRSAQDQSGMSDTGGSKSNRSGCLTRSRSAYDERTGRIHLQDGSGCAQIY